MILICVIAFASNHEDVVVHIVASGECAKSTACRLA